MGFAAAWVLAIATQDGIQFKQDLQEALKEAKQKKTSVLIAFFQPG
ncbi:MAG TPA: hypothetical protein VI643_03920 [Planctomycetota bacterium]|nr:hypothetical protein [Planctomycetota bacterium]